MKKIQEYIGQSMIGQKYHFKSNCMFPIDTVGTIKAFKIINAEIIFSVDIGSRIIQIGEKHPGMMIEKV